MVKHRVVLTGGGTGGHIYPALAVAEQLKEDEEVEAILYIGAQGHLEEKLAADSNLEFVGISVAGMPRKISPALFRYPFAVLGAAADAQRHMRKFKPTVVLGTGGYASAPPLIAAYLSNIPIAIHEPDAHPGLVNRVFSRIARLVSCGMAGAVDRLGPKRGRVVVNGNPVRGSFLVQLPRDSASAVLGLDPKLKTLLITGGSQGAKAINDAVVAALPGLLAMEPAIQVVHQAGKKNTAEIKETMAPELLANPRYILRDYFDDLSLPYGVCDLAVCRAGAMTIAELAVKGTPAIFVPYPHAAADHQTHNARFMESAGAAVVLPQTELNADRLLEVVVKLLADEERLASMSRAMLAQAKPQAARDLCLQVKELSTENQIRLSKRRASTL